MLELTFKLKMTEKNRTTQEVDTYTEKLKEWLNTMPRLNNHNHYGWYWENVSWELKDKTGFGIGNETRIVIQGAGLEDLSNEISN
jgi:aspartyl/asparaginyl-tRNA synthetase